MSAVITVTTGPTSRSLVELATVKASLGIASSDTSQDAELSRLIEVAGYALAGPQGLDFEPWRQTYTIKLPSPHGGIALRFPVYPIESVSSVQTIDGITVDATTYEIGGPRRDRLIRDDRWNRSFDRSRGSSLERRLDYQANGLVAGWLMPGEVATWETGASYGGAGEKLFARATSSTAVFLFEATTAGASGGAEPTWPAAAGGTVVDGSVTWTAREASELPADLREAALVTVADYVGGGLEIPAGVLSEGGDGWRTIFRDVEAALPLGAQALARRWR